MKKRSEQEWQNLFAQQVASGLSANQFCEENDLCAKYFSLRKKQLLRYEPSSSAFVPITLNPANTLAKSILEPALVLRHGICSLYFDVAPNPNWLAQLLRTLV